MININYLILEDKIPNNILDMIIDTKNFLQKELSEFGYSFEMAKQKEKQRLIERLNNLSGGKILFIIDFLSYLKNIKKDYLKDKGLILITSKDIRDIFNHRRIVYFFQDPKKDYFDGVCSVFGIFDIHFASFQKNKTVPFNDYQRMEILLKRRAFQIATGHICKNPRCHGFDPHTFEKQIISIENFKKATNCEKLSKILN